MDLYEKNDNVNNEMIMQAKKKSAPQASFKILAAENSKSEK